MSIPFALPDWLPWWAVTLAMAPVLIYALMVFIVPFNTFGVKDRLDVLEARLDEIQNDIRQLSIHPREVRAPDPDERYAPPARPASARGEAYEAEEPRRAAPRRASERPTRAEPRLDWPR